MEKRGAEIACRPPEVVECRPRSGHLDGLAAVANDDFLYRAQEGLGIGITEGGGSGRAFGFRHKARGFEHLTGAVAALSRGTVVEKSHFHSQIAIVCRALSELGRVRMIARSR